MPAQTRRIALVVATIILVSGLAISASATTSAPEPLNSTDANTTPSHLDPAEVTEDGDSQQVGAYLARQLGSRLNASAIATSNEEYETGRALIGDDYSVLLEQYAAVAADTDLEETAAQFNLTREQQREIIVAAQQLNQTATAYQQAVENGNETEARTLARSIVQNASELNQTTATLSQQYKTLETQTDLDFAPARDALNTSQRRLTQAAGVVATREFTETNVTVQPTTANLSATAPTVVSGRLTATNGTAIANATIQVGIGEDTVVTQTNANGTYTTTYQPLAVTPNASTLTVAYTPAPTAPYLSSTATENISVHGQSATAVTITKSTTTARFADPVTVSGYVNTSVGTTRSQASLPVTLTIAGEQLTRTETVDNGSFAFQTALPERIPAGKTELRVGLQSENLILASSNTTASLTVDSTPTTLTVERADSEDTEQNITITGTLTTADGDPLTDRTVRLRIADTPLETIETDALGQYRTTIDRDSLSSDAQTLTVQFAPSRSNLEASTAELPLPVSSGLPVSRPALVGGALAILVVSGGWLIWWRNKRPWGSIQNLLTGDGSASEPPFAPTESPHGADLSASVPAADGVSVTETLRERAQTALDAGETDTAVQLAYAAFRAHASQAGGNLPETHWELYNRWQSMTGADSTELYELTNAYEQAAFAPESVSSDTAQTVIGLLPSVIDGSETHTT